MSNSHVFLYYTNSALMFYFIRLNCSIKCEKHEELYTELYLDLSLRYMSASFIITQRMDINQFHKVTLIALKQSKTDKAHLED